jgi:DNA-binding ferritin-like protein
MHDVVRDMLQMQNQMRIFHWQTKSYAAHKALGKAYENLDELIDTFVETALGRPEVSLCNGNIDVKLFDIKELDLQTALTTYKTFLSEITNKLNPEIDADLLNIRDDMLGVINHTCYLLKLS